MGGDTHPPRAGGAPSVESSRSKWHARGQGFESPQLHSEREVQTQRLFQVSHDWCGQATNASAYAAHVNGPNLLGLRFRVGAETGIGYR